MMLSDVACCGLDSARLMVQLDDLKGLFQTKKICNFFIKYSQPCPTSDTLAQQDVRINIKTCLG